MIHRLICTLLIHTVMASSAIAQTPQPRYFTFSNGTGFYVSKDGYIITNAHVVKPCTQNVKVHSGATTSEAQVISRNDKLDLALLKSRDYAPDVASLRTNAMDIKQGEPVIVMGYAGAAGAGGTYSFVKSQVLDTKGPTGEAQWLQFANAAQKGNSGGPLLDASGHVIGVITGKTQLFRVDNRANVAPTKIGESDVAINLAYLTAFLDQQRVRYQAASSGMLSFSDNRLESSASNFIVQLQCQTN